MLVMIGESIIKGNASSVMTNVFLYIESII